LVDDEEMILEVGQSMLQRMGFEVLVAASGSEAIEIFKRHSGEISCVVLDLSMPGMSGQETFGALQEINRDVRVIFTSGYSEKEVSQYLTGITTAGFIQKPFLMGTLADKIKSIIET